jgi:O-antigen/teichoic acid export membrane protein
MSTTRSEAHSTAGAFRRDVAWNMGSFGIIAVSALLINTIIGRFYGATSLGVFNQVITLYIILAQISVLGINLSVLHQLSVLSGREGTEEHKTIASVVLAALLGVGAVSGCVALLGWALADAVGALFDSADVARGWLWIIPGLIFFSLNKVLLSTLNGLNHLRAFAIGNGGRWVLIFLFLGVFAALEAPGAILAGIFSFAEGVLFACLAVYLFGQLRPFRLSGLLRHLRGHFDFGIRGMLSGTLTELNIRVDVLVLGIFLNDAMVGVYSAAAQIFEGLALLPSVFRTILNPMLARAIDKGNFEALRPRLRSVMIMVGVGMVVVALVAIGLYPIYVDLILVDPTFKAGHLVLVILMGGLVVAAPYLPLDMLLVQGGHPWAQTRFRLAIVVLNLALNFALVPFFGLVGAALGTALSFASTVLWLKLLARRELGVRI